MTTKIIYVYEGIVGTIQTPIQFPMQEARQMRRLIADEGKILVNDNERTNCIDVEIADVSNWSEIDEEIEQDVK